MISINELNWEEDMSKTYVISINIDGLPLFNRSAHYTFHPIHVRIGKNSSKILTAGMFCSNKSSTNKIGDIQAFLADFIDDLQSLIRDPITTKYGNFILSLNGPIICDAPCRAELKTNISHTGYSSCERCIVHGINKGSRETFAETDSQLRTEVSYRLRSDENHHKSMVTGSI